MPPVRVYFLWAHERNNQYFKFVAVDVWRLFMQNQKSAPEMNHPVKMSRAFMTAAATKCAVYEGGRFETVICSQAPMYSY
jgi:hypothetical protein